MNARRILALTYWPFGAFNVKVGTRSEEQLGRENKPRSTTGIQKIQFTNHCKSDWPAVKEDYPNA